MELVLIANNKRCANVKYDMVSGYVVRFNHCLAQTRHLMNGKTDAIVLRSHNWTDYPWGVNSHGQLKCPLVKRETVIIKLNPSRFLCSNCTEFSTRDCKFRRADCSSGYFILNKLGPQFAHTTLIGFSSHYEDHFYAKFHDYPSEKKMIAEMVRTKTVSLINCWKRLVLFDTSWIRNSHRLGL